jgi:hypothetical protein
VNQGAPPRHDRGPAGTEGRPTLGARVRAACAEVVRRARHVRLDEDALAPLADAFATAPPAADPDPAHHPVGPPADTLAFVITLDAVNFGSGWFPHLRKRPGTSGYFTIATGLREHFERHGPWRAEQLARLGPADCAAIFDQDLGVPEPAELMGLFAQAWNELGAFLLARYGGRFAGPLAEADGDLERIAEILGTMPLFRDVARYDELEVPFYKRAQITAADLASSDIGEQGDRLHGVERLTAFADNLVPHTLRCEGVLHYAPALTERIEREEPIAPGSAEEVEIRAAGVHAVERLVAVLGEGGVETCAARVDAWLWNRGQSPAVKARPRHRTRTVFY